MLRTTGHEAKLEGGPFDRIIMILTISEGSPPPPDFIVKVSPWNSDKVLATARYKLLSQTPLRYEFVG